MMMNLLTTKETPMDHFLFHQQCSETKYCLLQINCRQGISSTTSVIMCYPCCWILSEYLETWIVAPQLLISLVTIFRCTYNYWIKIEYLNDNVILINCKLLHVFLCFTKMIEHYKLQTLDYTIFMYKLVFEIFCNARNVNYSYKIFLVSIL